MLAFWTSLWWWWLLGVAASWATFEGLSIVAAVRCGQRVAEVWTLSETIRRWSSARRWLAPLVIGATAALLAHFFGQVNP